MNIYFTTMYKIGYLKELKKKKKLTFQEQHIHILLYFTWRSNKTSSPSLHQGFNLDCCSKNSQEKYLHDDIWKCSRQTSSNTQSIWLLPMRKSSKRSRIQCRYSLRWHPKGSANSSGLSLLDWICFNLVSVGMKLLFVSFNRVSCLWSYSL